MDENPRVSLPAYDMLWPEGGGSHSAPSAAVERTHTSCRKPHGTDATCYLTADAAHFALNLCPISGDFRATKRGDFESVTGYQYSQTRLDITHHYSESLSKVACWIRCVPPLSRSVAGADWKIPQIAPPTGLDVRN